MLPVVELVVRLLYIFERGWYTLSEYADNSNITTGMVPHRRRIAHNKENVLNMS